MATLDQRCQSQSPSTWTGDRVRARLVEAFVIERRMPGDRFVAIASAWPASPVSSFADYVGWGPDARERVWEAWERAKGVLPYEITRWEETVGWLQYLPPGERTCLSTWALSEARGLNISAIIEKRRWSRTVFYRKRNAGAARIAERLNAQGVVVR
jgi:hypothetical protein